jgi:hypothetical protein
MSEYLPRPGDTVCDADGIEHMVIRCVPGDTCTWVMVATVSELGYFAQFPIDELSFVHDKAVA